MVHVVSRVTLYTLALCWMATSANGKTPPKLTVEASQTTAQPGEEITFSWSIDDQNSPPIRRATLRIDGEPVRWKSPHVWKAIPGTHVFHVQVRWGDDQAGKKEPYVFGCAQVEVAAPKASFIHPGIYSSQEELERIKANVKASDSHPMQKGWKELLQGQSDRITGRVLYTSLDWTPHPVAVVDPKSDAKIKMRDDALAAYAHALQWVVTGRQEHADKSIEIYNAWSQVFEDIRVKNGDIYPSLFTSWTANIWVSGAEIIRHYDNGASGWQEKDIVRFESMCRVFERLTLEWIGYVGPYGGQNQGTGMARTRMALGIFLNDQALFDSGKRLLLGKQFSSRDIRKLHGNEVNLLGLSVASSGEIMEFNRDAAHGTGSFNSIVNGAEILRHQPQAAKTNLYDLKMDGEKTPRVLKGSELYAKSYLQGPIEITTRKDFRNKVRARHTEMLLNYYNHLSPEKHSYPLSKEVNQALRPVGVVGGYDLPWTTLSHGDLSAAK